MLQLDQFKSILCLNGDLPEKEFFSGKLPIVAADGAANTLMEMGIEPEMVIGDLDSINPDYLKILKSHHHYDQDLCDYQKSIFYMKKNDLLPAIIVGVNGGYLDHILNNINLFLTGDNVLYAPPLTGFCMKQGDEKKLTLPTNTKISLLGIPEAVVNSTGLKWELSNYHCAFPGRNSCFNRTVAEGVSVNVKSGKILVLIYNQTTSMC